MQSTASLPTHGPSPFRLTSQTTSSAQGSGYVHLLEPWRRAVSKAVHFSEEPDQWKKESNLHRDESQEKHLHSSLALAPWLKALIARIDVNACGFYPVDVCRDLWYPHVDLSRQPWYWCSDPLHPSQHGQHQMYHHISSASKLYHCSPRTQRDKQESWVICHYNCCMTQW